MSKQDYYDVLGVAKDSSQDVLKKAFRKIALDCHPDRNPGNKESEEKFKSANEAYGVLSDTDKRAHYDKHGHSPVSNYQQHDWSSIFHENDDMFANFFGNRGHRQQRQQKNNDIEVNCSVTLADAMSGCKKDIEVNEQFRCKTCEGAGAKECDRKPCETCHGAGTVTMRQGMMILTTTCNRCGGRRFSATKPCETCEGRGAVIKTTKLNVTVPAGIEIGQVLKVAEKGSSEINNIPAGDLYVILDVQGHKDFIRDGDRLHTKLDISMFDSLLGSEKEITLPTGEKVNLKIKKCTQPNDKINVQGYGMPVLGSNKRGNLVVNVNVTLPKSLSEEAEKQFNMLKAMCEV